jgi:DNA adenine methylase
MISYIGGKSRMAKWISGYIPNDIETYVEVFGGAFWVYVNGDVHTRPNLKKVIYNDFNRYMVNLFECCKSPKEFHDFMLDIISQNEDLFYQYKKEVFEDNNVNDVTLGDMNFAMKYAYIVTQVFSGLNPEKSKFINLKGKYKSKFDSFRGRLVNPKFTEKLKLIDTCENMDYSEVIEKYDSPTTYFYVDPPYWKTENYYSLHDFDREDHEKLCMQLKNIEGRFSLSYYDFELLGEWLPESEFTWVRKEFVKAASARKDTKQNKGEELLIMNYKLNRFF